MPTISWTDIHGAVTHFPIAMLVTGILFDLGGVIFKKDEFRKVGFWMLVIAVLGAIGALISGWFNGNSWFTTAIKPPIFYQHRNAAFIVSGIAAVLLIWRCAKKDRLTGPALYASLILGIMIAAGVGKVGYLGGQMAFPEQPSLTAQSSATTSSRSPMGAARSASGPGATSAASAQSPALVAAGKSAFNSDNLGCNGCHSINGVGGRSGPDLSHEGTRQPDVKWQLAHLVNPQKFNKNSSMPPYSGTDPKTLNSLAAYVVSLK